jgi:hypothetical protein
MGETIERLNKGYPTAHSTSAQFIVYRAESHKASNSPAVIHSLYYKGSKLRRVTTTNKYSAIDTRSSATIRVL